VTTRTDFSDEAQMKAFPMDIGKWHGTDYDTTSTAQVLNAPVVLLRGYDPETFTQPIFLTIVQSKTSTSFHKPEVCFNDQGYKIQEDATETLTITDPEWTKHPSGLTIPLNKMIITRSATDGDIFERRVVLFFYVKGNQLYSDAITMIQVQGLIPLTGSYAGTLNEEKTFLAQIFPLMFQPGSGVDSRPVIVSLAQRGVIGYLGIFFILLVPVVVIAFPFLRRKDAVQ
jgi:hypothetical protein